MVDWIDNWLAPQFFHNERVLLVMDSAPGHKTMQVKEACKRNNIDICMIPGGCTKYLQPLDLKVNRSFKSRLKNGYSRMMKLYSGVIDKGKKESANKINMRELLQNVKESADTGIEECVSNGWNRMEKQNE
jgi:hypothetical protein